MLKYAFISAVSASANQLQTSSHEVCDSIRQCIDEGIVAVSQTLHYNCDSAFHYSFYCTHPSCTKPPDHLAVCYDNDPVAMECSKSGEPCDLPDNCRIWFGHPVRVKWCTSYTQYVCLQTVVVFLAAASRCKCWSRQQMPNFPWYVTLFISMYGFWCFTACRTQS